MRRKIEDIKTLPGIDTLYYFIPISDLNYIEFYSDFVENEYIDDNWKFLGYSSKNTGFVGSWFEYSIESDKYGLNIPIFKVGFKSPFKQKNVPNVYVQLLASGIYLLGLENLITKVSSVLAEYLEILDYVGDDFTFFQVSRVDVNMFVDYDFSKANWQCFKSPARSYTQNFVDGYEFVNGGELETIYLGKRSSDICLRVYNKLRELETQKRKNPLKFIIMSDYFERNGFVNTQSIWNIEFMLKREALKSYGIYTLSDLFLKVGNVFKDLMSKYVFLGFDSEKYSRLRKSKHLNRVSPNPVWEYFRNSFDIYDSDFVKRSVKQYSVDYDRYYKEKLTSDIVKARMIGVDVENVLRHMLKVLGKKSLSVN